ncbi:hypothetical protein FQA39_LY01712 [Lamprigera yunnana]|nr:hypothetical protein FQA39_LY01712 [Lamprigera yunnana]
MEIQKLTKRKIKAQRDGNKNALASVCIDLAQYYVDQCRYDDAIAEYEIVADAYKEMGKMLEFASANRGIGECYIKLQEYDKALEYQQIHMGIAKEQKNKLEEQRALATIGHIHLTQYIDHPDKRNKSSLNLASIAFNKSLALCRSLTDVKKYEHKDMIARLLSNLGVVEECKGQYDKGIELLQESIQICEGYDLFEQLHRGYIALSTLYDRKKVYDEAIRYCNLALSVAERLKNKVNLMRNALLTKSDILIKVGDLHTAKNVLLKAYKLKDPNVSNNESIEQNLKVVVAMCRAEDGLLTTESCDYKIKKSLYEKLGDGACYLKNFSCAIEYYHKMLEAAKNNNESGLDLSPCYISLAETYRDNKQYDLAIQYFQEDYNILKDNPRDAVTTMLSIADCLEATKTNFYEIECVYDQALSICKKTKDKHMEYKVLLRYVNMLKAYKKPEKACKYGNDLKNIDSIAFGSETESEGQNTPNIGDDIVISEITDVSDESDSENRTLRKRAKKFRVTRNYKGETQLHKACIKGNLELVKHLLNQGHPVNVRDNCGWLPLHEACIYGRVETVMLLIENGAAVNDRGGMLCQGITPLHDAASNGHLEVIQLLLDNGASSVSKNDNGEIPLHLLKLWYNSQNLDDNQLALYNVIIKQLTLDAEKLALPLETCVSNKPIIVKDQEVAYKPKRETPERNRHIRNSRRTVDIDHDNTITCKNPETPAQSEYQRVMDNLRHPSREEIDKKRKSDESKVSAYVVDDFDDWLDDDMILSRKKPKTTCSNELINSNTTHQNATNYIRHSSSSSLNSTIGDKDEKFNDSDTDATVPFHPIDNSDRDKRKNSRCNDNAKNKRRSVKPY